MASCGERVAKAYTKGQHASLVQARRPVDVLFDEVVFTLGVPGKEEETIGGHYNGRHINVMWDRRCTDISPGQGCWGSETTAT